MRYAEVEQNDDKFSFDFEQDECPTIDMDGFESSDSDGMDDYHYLIPRERLQASEWEH